MIRSVAGFFLVGVIVLALILVGCTQTNPTLVAKSVGQAPGVASPAPVVQVATVQRGAVSSNLSYSGNVQARQQVNLIPKVAGRVTKLAVDIGSAVKAGDALLELDRDALEQQVAQAEAGLAAAQAKLDGLEAGPRDEQVAQAEANLKAAQARLDQLKAGPTKDQLEAAEAQVRLAKNQLYLAQTQADAALGSRFPNTYTPEQKEAQSGVIWEQIKIAEANLAQLKAGPTAEQVAQAEAAVEAAQQQVTLAKQPVTKYDLEAVRATVAQAKAAVSLAKIQLAEATIRAPFDGVISQRLVSEGAMVGPTSPVLVLISADTEVVINVDERALVGLKAGQTATVTASAFPGEKFPATIASVAPAVDAKSRTAQVRLSPKDAEGKLRDGMFAQVQLPVGTARGDTLMVPKSAVAMEDRDTVTYVVVDGRVKRQVVTTGATEGDLIEIVAGLSDGQKVVVSGLSGLRDGVEVTIK